MYIWSSPQRRNFSLTFTTVPYEVTDFKIKAVFIESPNWNGRTKCERRETYFRIRTIMLVLFSGAFLTPQQEYFFDIFCFKHKCIIFLVMPTPQRPVIISNLHRLMYFRVLKLFLLLRFSFAHFYFVISIYLSVSTYDCFEITTWTWLLQ